MAAKGFQCDLLLTAIQRLRHALAWAPGITKPDRRFKAELSAVIESLREHILMTEAPDGLLGSIEEQHPRLNRWADKLRQEHTILANHLEDFQRSLADLGESGGHESFERVCARGAALADAMQRHHEEGTELLFQAYVADMGVKG